MLPDMGFEIPFGNHLGFICTLNEAGRSHVEYKPRPEHLNTFGFTHGGALMALMDITMVMAARNVQKDAGAVTIEMKTTFMRPSPGSDGILVCKGEMLHRSATLAFVEAKIFDHNLQLCAHSTGTFKYVLRSK